MNRLTLILASALTTLVAPILPAHDASYQFYEAIRLDNLNQLRSLVKEKSVLQKDRRGGTPLLYAAAFGSFEALQILVRSGADVNEANDFGATPLMFSINDPRKAEFLIAHGAGVNARSKMGRTPLLIASATDGGSETVKLLLDRGAKFDVRDDLQTTPLLAAAYANDLATLGLLMDRGANANEKDASGMTPLMWAAANGQLAAVKLLLAKGADVNAVSVPQAFGTVKNGAIALGSLTPLLLAAPYGGAPMLEVLLDSGAKINAQDVRGMTPLMLAIATDRADPKNVRLLIKRGADLNKKDCTGLTARDWAAKYNSPAILHELGMQPVTAETKELIGKIAGALPTSRQAAQNAVALLQRTSTSFSREGGCVACHAQNLLGMTVKAAASAHISLDQSAANEDSRSTHLQLGAAEQPLLQRMDPPAPEILSYALLQLAAGDIQPDRGTDAMVYNLAAQQRQAGNWHMGVARPPMGDGDFSRTALSIRALQLYGLPGRQADFQKRIERAASWLASTTPRNTEDLNMQLLGLHWADAHRQIRQDDVRRLERLQREDGGWAQTPDLPTDAYATGQVLYTLHELGIPADSPVYRRGVDYLLRTQKDDGSWLVRSRAVKIQPYFQSGFPYGHDQWISSAGTAWAAIALSFASVPDRSTASLIR